MPAKLGGVGAAIGRLAVAAHQFEVGRIEAMHRAVRMVEGDVKNVSMTAHRAPPLVIRRGKQEAVLLRGGIGGLAVRSGHLRASVTGEVLPAVRGKVTGIVGTPIRWAWVHEFGATIRAKKAFMLIPLFLQRAGTARARGKAGKFAVTSKARSAGARRAFLRAKSVTMPKRRPFAQSVDRMREPVRALFEGFVRAFVRRANG